jgi:bacteriocin biosynthesis cyclodehydratase domain-containing protein
MTRLPQRPCLALPFTVLPGDGCVCLVAGEDFRYTLSGAGLEAWLPGWLPALDGSRPLDDLLAGLPEERRGQARELIARLHGERVLIDGPARQAHVAGCYRLRPEGSGPLYDALAAAPIARREGAIDLPALCQDRLDYDEALRFNERCLAGESPWLWATCGPLSRGYVSPVFLPDAGPCLACLLHGFRRLSPAPELYDEMIEYASKGGAITAATFPARAAGVLQQLVAWKAELLEQGDPPAALYQLHVLEVSTLEVTAHRVFFDPECPSCRGRR